MAGSASRVVFAIYAAGLENDVAFVSDGQLSGLCNKGLTIAEVSRVVEIGQIDPEVVVTPGIFVDRILDLGRDDPPKEVRK